MTLLEMKKQFILSALVRNNYNRSKTARELDIAVRSLTNYIRDWFPELKRNKSTLNLAKKRDNWNNRDKW